MTISQKHPLYIEHFLEWKKLRDVMKGEAHVKSQGTDYLPATSGMIAQGMTATTEPGYLAYAAYRTRAHFPEVMDDAVKGLIGAMHHKPPVIELPAAMEPLRERATLKHESLEMLLQRINYEQLVVGRCGLLADLPEVAPIDALPYLSLYTAENITNWDDGPDNGTMFDSLNLVVLDEGGWRREGFTWKEVESYRVLVLGDPMANEPLGEGIYSAGLYEGSTSDLDVTKHIEPTLRGESLNFIPFTFINSTDIVAEPNKAPLIGLADLALLIYRGEADYRQSLFMTAQDTLVVTGGNTEQQYHVGSNGGIVLPEGADAKFIGVTEYGLSEQRLALENDRNAAALKGGQLMDSVSRERESGDALKIRVSARTASIARIALSGAFGLQHSLRQVARWIGADEDKVIVEPNLDFVDDTLDSRALSDLMMAKGQGAPYSLQSIHDYMFEHGLTSKTFEEELALIEGEADLMPKPSPAAAPVENEDEEDDGSR